MPCQRKAEITKSLPNIIKKPRNLYQDQLENNVNDIEMQRLQELYGQAVQNGWLEQEE